MSDDKQYNIKKGEPKRYAMRPSRCCSVPLGTVSKEALPVSRKEAVLGASYRETVVYERNPWSQNGTTVS